MNKFCVIIVSYFLLNSLTLGLNNGLALTPPMGWMHWERFRCLIDCEAYPDECVREQLFKTMADLMVSENYKNSGYEYIIIDDCWSSKKRDSNNKLQADPVRFPSGIKALADYIHNKGLKLGIYADYGTETCAGFPGSMDYLKIDANTFADWGVDYLKLDGCNSPIIGKEAGYSLMSQFLNETGRSILYTCGLPAYLEPFFIHPNYTKLAEICNSWRNWDDIQDSWSSVQNILRWFGMNQERFARYAGPGHWNDPDMLIIGNYGLSYEQAKAQMAIWTIIAAPLIMSVDLRNVDEKFKEILQNKELIDIDQDSLGIQGKFIMLKESIEFWTRPINPVIQEENSFAIGLLSERTDGYPYRINFTLSDLNLTNPQGYSIHDVFDKNTIESIILPNERIFVRVKPTGTVLLKATPAAASSLINVVQVK